MITFRFTARGKLESGGKFTCSGLVKADDAFAATVEAIATVERTFGAKPDTVRVAEKSNMPKR